MKNKSKLSALIILLIALSTACQKTVFNRFAAGQVVDATTGLPVAGAWVELNRSQTEFLGRTTIETEAKSTTTADGRFDFAYRKSRGWSYEVYAGADDYFFDPSQDYVRADGENKKNLLLKLIPKALLVFDIRNTKGGGGVSFTTMNTRNNQITSSTGQGTFKIFPIEVEGNKHIEIRYYITLLPSGQEVRYDTTLYCPSFQSTTYLLEF